MLIEKEKRKLLELVTSVIGYQEDYDDEIVTSTFVDYCIKKHFNCMTEYCSLEMQDMEKGIDLLWGNDEILQKAKIILLTAYLKSQNENKRELPVMELFNYTI